MLSRRISDPKIENTLKKIAPEYARTTMFVRAPNIDPIIRSSIIGFGE
jgi:hypothetical protein